MSTNANGTSSPCNSKEEDKVASSRVIKHMCNYQPKKKVIFYFSTYPTYNIPTIANKMTRRTSNAS
jgi:hypothetical protein